jgi:hypothetical protein
LLLRPTRPCFACLLLHLLRSSLPLFPPSPPLNPCIPSSLSPVIIISLAVGWVHSHTAASHFLFLFCPTINRFTGRQPKSELYFVQTETPPAQASLRLKPLANPVSIRPTIRNLDIPQDDDRVLITTLPQRLATSQILSTRIRTEKMSSRAGGAKQRLMSELASLQKEKWVKIEVGNTSGRVLCLFTECLCLAGRKLEPLSVAAGFDGGQSRQRL